MVAPRIGKGAAAVHVVVSNVRTIAISGASGFIGTALSALLKRAGARVRPLVRPGKHGLDGIQWDPERGTIDSQALEGVDAIVHLAGDGVAEGRWSAEKKARIRESRVLGTGLLARAITGLSLKPGVFVSASAIGYYGDRGDEELDERSTPGDDFLAEVCKVWESSADPARAAGVRVVHPRIGIVLSPEGGALKKMLPPFKLGLGGRFGDGKQYMSWIALEDAVRALVHALDHKELRGPLNLTAPRPVTNAELTKSLGAALHRPTIMPVPGPLARLALGEMADVALLSGARVLPRQLLASGFQFEHPALKPYLERLLA
ncbi:MAG TPA: TIGR01777 family oxidoreductase [Polyangiales bacterium]|nr:TIGR01777 family oxidoreductase [Polyangiales bacterium]